PARLLADAAALAGGEPLLVVVTSGTTGVPRGVVRTTASWHASLPGFDDLLGPACPPGTVVWAPGGASSTLTLFALWHALATGRPVVASGRWRARDAAVVGADAPLVQCVPAVLADVLAAREAGGLPHLRRAVVAGAATPPALVARARRAGITLAEYYGAAELSFVAADPDGTGLRAFPGAEVAVRSGRIAVRSPYLALGYLPTGTDGPLRREPGGWASVGDRGSLDASGHLTVDGRGDTVISVGGHVVALDDVERVLTGVPGVAEAVCLAEPDERLGARVLAVVRPGPAVWPGLVRALRTAARDGLAAPARPVRYVLREDLPRTPGGKVARRLLLAELVPGGPSPHIRPAPGDHPDPAPAPARTLAP
ncbi:MAG: long-chain acyl-CoA synthetase, partial [Actinomycetota bacterium]|nr:long-chain acyl-CoA synthetase [Actinomycetota bacterium]